MSKALKVTSTVKLSGDDLANHFMDMLVDSNIISQEDSEELTFVILVDGKEVDLNTLKVMMAWEKAVK